MACTLPCERLAYESVMKTILCFGEVLLRLTAPDHEQLLRSAHLQACFGGAEVNTAISLGYFGHRARIVTTLPDNAVGDACVGELRRHGIDTATVARRPGRMGLYYLTTGAMLRPARVLYDRAHSAFAEADPALYDWPALLAGTDWLHISGITPALSATAARALQDAVEEAQRRGVSICFDCNIRPSLWQGREAQAVQAMQRFAQCAHLLLGNPHDIARMFGGDFAGQPAREAHAAAAATAMAACPSIRYVAATHRIVHSADHHTLTGYLADRSAIACSRAFELNPVLERIGAGDAFAAGVLHSLCADLQLQDAVDFAAAATALKHTLPGDFNTLREQDVRHLLASGGLDVQR